MARLRTALQGAIWFAGAVTVFLLLMGLATVILVSLGWHPPSMDNDCGALHHNDMPVVRPSTTDIA